MDNLKYVKLVDYDMKFPKKCPNCKQSFYDQEKHTFTLIITCKMLNKFTGEGSGMGALFGWAGLKLTEPLPKYEIRHIVNHKPN